MVIGMFRLVRRPLTDLLEGASANVPMSDADRSAPREGAGEEKSNESPRRALGRDNAKDQDGVRDDV
jgi:hypothetical protein